MCYGDSPTVGRAGSQGVDKLDLARRQPRLPRASPHLMSSSFQSRELPDETTPALMPSAACNLLVGWQASLQTPYLSNLHVEHGRTSQGRPGQPHQAESCLPMGT